MDLSLDHRPPRRTKEADTEEDFLLNDDAFSALWNDQDRRKERKTEPARIAQAREFASVFRVR